MTLLIERLPAYWRGRLNTRNALADHGDHEAHDAQIAAEYAAIMADLGAGKPLSTIAAYRRVSERVMTMPQRSVS